ncbi:hypothetical protein [Caballeronia sp. AZ7_KS35]|uniref:hypothetical protein n=1 Tax=Caballeronia sp. AZ7_KS35 TaxID=2921762 RepID=UPI0020294233|nr:hypothetical protein [Caballeronia sp. AZ7_KS35]
MSGQIAKKENQRCRGLQKMGSLPTMGIAGQEQPTIDELLDFTDTSLTLRTRKTEYDLTFHRF